MKHKTIVLAVCLLLAGCGVKPYDNDNRYAVIISIDALRWDLPSECHTPTLDSLRAAGTYCETFPVFPANTFPSHYSMATGLHPDHHGIVNNRFHLRDMDRTVLSWNPDDITLPGFWGGEPIWNTAERQGRIAHTYLWAGSQTPINGRQATRWIPYRFDASHRERMDWVLESLRGEHGEVPNLTMVYVEQLDATMHRYGSNAPETLAELESIDEALGYFFREVRKLPVFDSLNIIVTSDHGTADTSPERYVNFYGKLDSTRVVRFIRGIPCSIEVDDDYVAEAVGILNSLGHMTAYARDEMPHVTITVKYQPHIQHRNHSRNGVVCRLFSRRLALSRHRGARIRQFRPQHAHGLLRCRARVPQGIHTAVVPEPEHLYRAVPSAGHRTG